LQYAPYSHLWNEEEWWPSDVAKYLQHVTLEVDYVAVVDNLTMKTLDTLAATVYLTSDDNVEDNPAWLLSTKNTPTSSRYSSAPATIIAVEKDSGILDVFYFYFCSYNHGNKCVSSDFEMRFVS
jgi:hypothetical protein